MIGLIAFCCSYWRAENTEALGHRFYSSIAKLQRLLNSTKIIQKYKVRPGGPIFDPPPPEYVHSFKNSVLDLNWLRSCTTFVSLGDARCIVYNHALLVEL